MTTDDKKPELTVADLFANVHELVESKGFLCEPRRQTMYIMEELGEFTTNILAATEASKEGKAPDKVETAMICEEAFDVVWNVFATLSSLGITSEVFAGFARDKMRVNAGRTFRED